MLLQHTLCGSSIPLQSFLVDDFGNKVQIVDDFMNSIMGWNKMFDDLVMVSGGAHVHAMRELSDE